MNNYKILCTGNPNKPGIAKSVFECFPNTTFLHLSNGYDLTSLDGQNKFKSIIKNYNVFINVSQLKDNSQEKLLKISHEEGMIGHVFNIGSIAEYKRWEWYNSAYTEEKRRLREASLDLCTQHFKTTHIVAGGFQDSTSTDPFRMDPIKIVQIIEFILDLDINIPIIGIEKIIDEELENQLKGKTEW